MYSVFFALLDCALNFSYYKLCKNFLDLIVQDSKNNNIKYNISIVLLVEKYSSIYCGVDETIIKRNIQILIFIYKNIINIPERYQMFNIKSNLQTVITRYIEFIGNVFEEYKGLFRVEMFQKIKKLAMIIKDMHSRHQGKDFYTILKFSMPDYIQQEKVIYKILFESL